MKASVCKIENANHAKPQGYKNFDNKFWCLEINIGQNLTIEYNLESGERDLLDDDIGIGVWDLEIGFG